MGGADARLPRRAVPLLPRTPLSGTNHFSRSLMPVVKLASVEWTRTNRANGTDHARFGHADGGFVHSPPTLETRVELVDRSRYVPRILSETRRVGPGGEHGPHSGIEPCP